MAVHWYESITAPPDKSRLCRGRNPQGPCEESGLKLALHVFDRPVRSNDFIEY